MSCELSVLDCFGRVVLLDYSNWEKHQADRRHLEVVPYHDRFPEVLRDPLIVVRAKRTGQDHYFREGLTRGSHHRLFLLLIVGEFDGIAKITTWRLVAATDTEGDIRWTR